MVSVWGGYGHTFLEMSYHPLGPEPLVVHGGGAAMVDQHRGLLNLTMIPRQASLFCSLELVYNRVFVLCIISTSKYTCITIMF